MAAFDPKLPFAVAVRSTVAETMRFDKLDGWATRL